MEASGPSATDRPWWMTVLAVVCTLVLVISIPRDLFVAAARDVEVWLVIWSEASPNGRGWPIGLAQAAALSAFAFVLLRTAAREEASTPTVRCILRQA